MIRAARGVALWMALAGVPAFAACNLVTGADDVRISDDDDGSSSSSTGGTTASSGVGGATSTGAQQASTGTGAGGSTTAATGSTTASTGTTGAGAGPGACEYPAGPYSVAQGGTVPPTLTWQGFVPGASSPTTISIQDLFDCDGSRGIDAIIIDTSQYG